MQQQRAAGPVMLCGARPADGRWRAASEAARPSSGEARGSSVLTMVACCNTQCWPLGPAAATATASCLTLDFGSEAFLGPAACGCSLAS